MNEFNVFSVAGKIIKDALLPHNQMNNGANVRKTQDFQQNISQNNMSSTSFIAAENLLNEYIAELKIQNMEFSQSSAYMKDLLNLPQEFKDFISKLQKMTQGQIFPQTDALNLLLIKNLLGNAPKEAMQKVLQTMAQMSRNGVDVTQLKDMLALIGASMAGSSNTELVKNILLLYIPFLPLNVKAENLDWETQEDKDGKEKGEKDDTVEILIRTVQYQNIRIILYCNGSKHVDMLVYCMEHFPKQLLTDFVKMFAKENGFTIKIGFEDIKQSNGENTQNASVKIMSGLVLNSCVMLILQSTINFILNIDTKKD